MLLYPLCLDRESSYPEGINLISTITKPDKFLKHK